MIKVIYLFFLILPLLIFGQQQKVLSVEQAISMALASSQDIRNLKIDEQIQYHKNEEIKGTALPQFSFSGQGSYYFSTPQVQFPTSNISVYEVLAKEGVKDANGNPISTSNASFSTQAVSFFAPLNIQFGLGVNQLLFQPDVFVAFQARQSALDYAKANTSVAEDKVRDAVKKAYYQVLIAEKQKSVLEQTMDRLRKLNSDMNQMFKQGFAEKLDIDKLEVALNNAETGLNQLNNAIYISSSVLKTTIGLTIRDSIILSDDLSVEGLKEQLLTGDDQFQYEDRKEVALLGIASKLQSLDIKRQKMAIYPTVAAFANYQRSGQRNAKFNPEQPWFWFSTGIVGISIAQPIFDGFQRKNKIAQSRLALEKVENSTSQIKKIIDLDVSVSKSALSNALLNLDVQQRNVDLAENVFVTTKKKYEAGLGSSFELLQADTELQRAQGAYFQALYDGMIAKTNFEKAIGKI